MEENYIGKGLKRLDAEEKVTGKTLYMTDLKFPDMLWGTVLRAKYPHAIIKSIDTSGAEALPGVEAVITWRDVPGFNGFGIVVPDQPVLCREKVRYRGDAVAAVAATSKELAKRALELIEVQYEELPVVESPLEGAKSEAPKVHEKGNIHLHTQVKRGNVRRGFEEADIVIENTYYTGRQEHAFLETEGGVAVPEADGSISIYAGSQYPYRDRMQLARCLAMPEEKIRIISSPVGGAFGGKDELTIQPILAILALKSRKPVKMVMGREESMISYWKRHPMILEYRTGAKKDGTLVANEIKIYSDTGAYASLGGPVLNLAIESSCGPYRIPNVDIDGYCVYTNNCVAGAMRGFGVPQVTFAMETQIDVLAEKLGMDPIEIRRKNALEDGDVAPIGHHLVTSVGIGKVLEKIENSRLWKERRKMTKADEEKPWIKRGVGMAITWQGIGLGVGLPDNSNAIIQMKRDGGFTVRVGCVEMGQGALTVFAQIAAEALYCPVENIEVIVGDTGATVDSGTTTASRSTYAAGNSIILASNKILDIMKEKAASMLGAKPEELDVKDGLIFHRQNLIPGLSYGQIAGAFQQGSGLPRTEGLFKFPVADKSIEGAFGLPHHIYGFCGQVALVEVDTLTGKVKVLEGLTVIDAGTVINRKGLEGQAEGGFVMGMGYALTEDVLTKRGNVMTPNFSTYIIPTSKDAPEIIETITVDSREETGPYGAKGIGEIVMVPTAPAITCAIHHATGKRVLKIPATAEYIYSLLTGGSQSEDID